MAKVFSTKNAIHRVVNSNEVEAYSRQGWLIVEIRQQDRIEQVSEQIPMQTGNGGYPTMFNQTRSLVVSEPKFLMVQDGSSALGELTRQLEGSKNDLYNLSHVNADLQSKMKAMEKTATEQVERLQRYAGDAEQSRDNYYAEQKLKRKMEEDIAKIRNAIGELKMKEILAS